MTRTFFELVLLKSAGAGASFLVVVLLGRLLGADGLGIFAFAMSWIAIAQLITTLGMHHYAVRAVPRMQVDNDYAAIRGFVRLATLVCTGLSVGLVLLAPWLAKRISFSPQQELQDSLLTAVILLVPLTLSQLRSGLLRGFGRPVMATIPEQILFPVLQLSQLAAFWALGYDVTVQAAIQITFISAVIVFLVGAWPLIARMRSLPSDRPQFLAGKWLIEGGKSSVLFAVGALMSTTDIVMLGAMSSAAETGVYAIAARFFLLMQIPALAASGAVSHLVAEFVASKKHAELADLSGKIATRTTVLAVAAAAVATWPALAAGSIFGVQFAGATTPILVMIWVRAAESVFGHPGSFLANGGWIGLTSIIAGGGVVLNIGLNYLLIPAYGALGAAVATSTAHFVTTLLMVFVVWQVLKAKCLPDFLRSRKEPT